MVFVVLGFKRQRRQYSAMWVMSAENVHSISAKAFPWRAHVVCINELAHEVTGKSVIYGLNNVGSRTVDLETSGTDVISCMNPGDF